MAKQLKYNKDLVGKSALAIADGAQVLDGLYNSGTAYSYNSGVSVGVATGYYWQDDYVLYVQLTNGMYAVVDYMAGDPDWNFDKYEKSITQYSQSQAQALVNKIIKNNEQIICNNLLCARYANKLTENQRAQVRELQHRLQARNNALQAGGLTKDVQTSYPAGYAEMSAYLDKLMAGEGVGVATWVVVVIAATVIAATATAAYFAYKSLADESEKDVKFSKDLTRTLTSKLTEEEYQQLLDETKGIVTKARIKQAVGSYGKVLTIAAFVVGGGLLYRWIKNNI